MRRRRLNSAIALKTARRKIGNVHKLHRLASVGAVLTLIFAGLAVLGLPPVAQAGPVKPTVSSFAVTPSALTFAGGSVTLSAQVTNAASCLFTSTKAGITGLPATVPCSNGTVTDDVGVPVNSGKRTTRYRLHLSVTSVKTVHAQAVSIFVSAAPLLIAAPTHVTVTPAYGALDVTWTPEAPVASYEVDGYTATATGPDLIVPQTCMGATTCFVSGLTNGTRYSVAVQGYFAVHGDPDGGISFYEPVGNLSRTVMAKPSGRPNCSYVGQYASLQGCDLSNADLSNVNLTGSDLSNANLKDANLTNADLHGTDLQGANLTGANLTDALAAGAQFQGAIMTNAVLSGEDLNGADFSGVDLSGVDLSGVDLTNGNLSGANLSNANLTGADLFTNIMTGTILSGTDFTSAVIGYENLTDDDLSNTNLTSTVLGDDNFTNANLTSANLTDAFVNGDDLTGATLTGATLTGATWSDTTCPDGTKSNTYNPQTCANDLS